jgi:integrase/recombinase XerD
MNVERFLAVAGYRPQTTETYRLTLSRISAWLDASSAALSDLTPEQFRTYLKPEWSPSYRYVTLAALKSYLRWDGQDAHPVLTMRERRVQSMPGRTIGRAEASALIAFLYQHRGRKTYRRTLAMLLLAYEGGLRASEVCGLTMHDLDLDRRVVLVRRKGGKKITPINFRIPVALALGAWLVDRATLPQGEQFLFLTDEGHKMSRDAWRLICLRLAKSAGLNHFSPHSLRRGAACRSYEAGMSSEQVREKYGWSDDATMRLYLRLAEVEVDESVLPSASIELPTDFMATMGAPVLGETS